MFNAFTYIASRRKTLQRRARVVPHVGWLGGPRATHTDVRSSAAPGAGPLTPTRGTGLRAASAREMAIAAGQLPDPT